MRILLIEDEPAIAHFIREGLEEEQFSVDVAENGKEGLQMATGNPGEYDLMLVDWMLPGASGIEICRAVRKQDQQVPVIFLTAKDTVDDAVFALETGANDYIRKPFSFAEMLARIRAQLREKSGGHSVFRYGGIEMDVAKHQVSRNGQPVDLTVKEFALLEYLLRHQGRVCRRARILEQVWDTHFDRNSAVIDVYINALRKKLDDPNTTESLIKTIRGVGYRIDREP